MGRSRYRNGRSGFIGVEVHRGRYRAYVYDKGRRVLGTYGTKEEAGLARDRAYFELHPQAEVTEFNFERADFLKVAVKSFVSKEKSLRDLCSDVINAVSFYEEQESEGALRRFFQVVG